MNFSVDAHAIGRHLAGNEVYIRNLLNSFAAIDRESEFIAYLSVDDPSPLVPSRFSVRRVSANPFARLGFELSAKLREDRPDLLHVQYTAPLGCPYRQRPPRRTIQIPASGAIHPVGRRPAAAQEPDRPDRSVRPAREEFSAASPPPGSGRQGDLVLVQGAGGGQVVRRCGPNSISRLRDRPGPA